LSRTLFSVGHSTHPIEVFLELLAGARIDAIADVRSAPYSRRHPHFSRERLAASLRERGIDYSFLGRELGARSPDPDVWEGGRVSFSRLARTALFAQGIERVREASRARRVALLCAEREPLECHRTILVCRALRADHDIFHILASGELENHVETERRLLARYAARQPGLFAEDALEQAYERCAARIAYRGEPPPRVSPPG
jgi:uncharacterized protein (DUF488 family)